MADLPRCPMNDLVTSPSLFESNDETDVLTDFSPVTSFSRGEDWHPALSGAPPGRRTCGLRPKILIATPHAQDAFLQGIGRYARERHWQLSTDMLHSGVFPRNWTGDGILAYQPARSDLSRSVSAIKVPSVTVCMSDECAAVPRLQPDDFAIGVLAANHLLDRGCRDFIWAPYLNDYQNRKRLAGFLSVLRPLGHKCRLLPPPHVRVDSAWSDDWENWRRAVGDALAALPKRAGLFAFNDCLSAEVAAVARASGIPIPEDLAIIGAGNELLECEAAPVPLTSIDLNLEGMAYQAAELLAAIMEGTSVLRKIITVQPKEVVARESTAFSQHGNRRVTQAREIIAAEFSDPALTVASIAEQIGVSRRQLEREFKRAKGCTAREYIENARMEEASRLLLLKPETKISTIAHQVGISAVGNFFRIFRKRFGTTPSTYRTQHADHGQL